MFFGLLFINDAAFSKFSIRKCILRGSVIGQWVLKNACVLVYNARFRPLQVRPITGGAGERIRKASFFTHSVQYTHFTTAAPETGASMTGSRIQRPDCNTESDATAGDFAYTIKMIFDVTGRENPHFSAR